jgi:UDP-N-acetylmuramoyl-tripeptide--D-alanyl-D-alanine ligase
MNGLTLTLGWVAKALGAPPPKRNADVVVREVVTDSRTLQPGDLFVALRGPRFDGHAFVSDVLERGALGVIVERHRGGGAARAIEVPDTLIALQQLAHEVRTAVKTRVIAITGSAGKTTTKEVIAALLATRFRVVKNQGNLNNHIGLPLSLMQLRSGPDVAVMELGMNHAGEISRLVEIAAPDVRVWTNVGDAHLGFFASADAIADAKAEILERADPRTTLVCNADDARVMARVTRFAGRTITFGEAEGATVRAVRVRGRGIRGMSADIVTPAGERTIETPLLGRGNLLNVLAATAVAIDAGIPLDQIVVEASRLAPADRRGVVRQLRDGITLIDDSYNSSPSALRRALEVVAHDARDRRTVAVLGEMLELGEHAIPLHDACGRAAAAAGLGRLFAIGGAPARALAEAAVAAGMPPDAVTHFAGSTDAAAAVAAALEAGDLVLVKGSRGTRTDIVADRIVAERG